jgi:hypothetical protein
MAANSKSQTLKNSHAVAPGRSIIERIQAQMDKRRKVIEKSRIEQGWPGDMNSEQMREFHKNQGRYEGLAAALALLRSSSVAFEIERSNERLGIE